MAGTISWELNEQRKKYYRGLVSYKKEKKRQKAQALKKYKITHIIRWPAAISSVAMAFVMRVAFHVLEPTSSTKFTADRGRKIRTR